MEDVRGSAVVLERSWEAAFTEHHQALVRLATFLGGDQRVAEDVVADVFCRAHDRLDRVDDGRAFLRRSVVNGVRDAHRRRVVRLRPLPVPVPAPDPVIEAALSSAAQRAVWAALRDLPIRQRECAVLRYLDDIPEADVAAALGISRTAVNTHLARARARLAEALEALR